MGDLKEQEIERIAAPAARVFLREYVRPARPVVLRGLADHWPARHWSLERLAREFGGERLPVAPVRGGVVKADARLGVVRHLTPFGEFAAALQAGGMPGYLTAREEELPRALRDGAPLPDYCAGAPWQVMKLWISAPGTVSTMHFDLADNLHTQIFGCKRFILVPQRDRARVYPNGWFSSIPNGCRADVENPDFARFPRLADVTLHVVDLKPGETLYLPRRWWHHVRSLEQSCSVNHWWARGLWGAVVKAGDLVKQVRGISR